MQTPPESDADKVIADKNAQDIMFRIRDGFHLVHSASPDKDKYIYPKEYHAIKARILEIHAFRENAGKPKVRGPTTYLMIHPLTVFSIQPRAPRKGVKSPPMIIDDDEEEDDIQGKALASKIVATRQHADSVCSSIDQDNS